MPNNRKVWCVRGETKDWSGHDLFRTEKVVALDNPFLPDLSQIPPARERSKEWPLLPLNGVTLANTRRMYGKIYEAVKKMYKPDDPPMGMAALGQKVGHLVRLANVAKQGDLVIYPDDLKPDKKREENKVCIGEIVSEYFYVACCFQHRRRVNWKRFAKGNLPNLFGPMLGFITVNNDLAVKVINKWKFGGGEKLSQGEFG